MIFKVIAAILSLEGAPGVKGGKVQLLDQCSLIQCYKNICGRSHTSIYGECSWKLEFIRKIALPGCHIKPLRNKDGTPLALAFGYRSGRMHEIHIVETRAATDGARTIRVISHMDGRSKISSGNV